MNINYAIIQSLQEYFVFSSIIYFLSSDGWIYILYLATNISCTSCAQSLTSDNKSVCMYMF